MLSCRWCPHDAILDWVRLNYFIYFWTREQIKLAKNAYVKALEYNKNHAKALQQLGWLHYKDEDDFRSAIEYLKRASEIGTVLYM